MKLSEHPAVQRFEARHAVEAGPVGPVEPLKAEALRALCLEAGADDAGFVALSRPEVAADRDRVREAFPATRTLVALVARTHPDAIRSPPRSTSNLEFHQTGHHLDAVAHRVVDALERLGVRAVNPPMAFPMEVDRDRAWIVSHKTVAVAAGLGRMGIHHNVIHPRFGSFVLLGTVLVAAEVDREGVPLDWNPCLECKLCVAACPVGAIGADGHFDFAACYTHNYREFMGGFGDWVETVAGAGSASRYRAQVSGAETSSMWQSLAYGPNYKSAYCVAVCPAGDDVIAPFLQDRGGFVHDVVDPLRARAEPVYVVPGSDAEAHVARRFPHKRARRVHNGLRARSIANWLQMTPIVFQRGRAAGLAATYHFRFTGSEPREATIVVRDAAIRVEEGLTGRADLAVTADAATWLRFLSGEASLAWAIVRRRIRIAGSPRLLRAFGRCFPR